MDLAKYRTIFIEESTEHFAEISRALLELEKDPQRVDSIDVIFRMAHSIKGMAASLGYDPITELAHKLEDRMQLVRAAGKIGPLEELSVLFRGLTALETMVATVRRYRGCCGGDPECRRARGARRFAARAKKKRAEPLIGAGFADPAASAPSEAPRPPPTVRVNTRTLDRFLSTVGEVSLNNQHRCARLPGRGDPEHRLADASTAESVVGELRGARSAAHAPRCCASSSRCRGRRATWPSGPACASKWSCAAPSSSSIARSWIA